MSTEKLRSSSSSSPTEGSGSSVAACALRMMISSAMVSLVPSMVPMSPGDASLLDGHKGPCPPFHKGWQYFRRIDHLSMGQVFHHSLRASIAGSFFISQP